MMSPSNEFEKSEIGLEFGNIQQEVEQKRPENADKDIQISEMHSAIDHMQTLFALKLCSKDMLPQQLVTEILTFSNEIHASKMELIAHKLKNQFHEGNVSINTVLDYVNLVDHSTGLNLELSTNYRREQHFKRTFKFIQPERTPIGTEGKSFYYRFLVKSTLCRLLNDDTVRNHIINWPLFTVEKVIFY